MDRRAVIRTLAGGLLAAPLMIRAQQSEKVYRIGYLRDGAVALPSAFWSAMRGNGWVEGKNLTIEPRYADQFGQLPLLADELVRLRVDLIIAIGTGAARAAQEATTTIPVVFSVAFDPIETGLASSLARPGANVTGFMVGVYDEKLLEVLKEALLGMSRAAYPYPVARPVGVPPVGQRLNAASHTLGIEITGTTVDAPEDFSRFFSAAKKAGVEAVVIPNIARWLPYLHRITAEATKSRTPTIGFDRRFVEAGGLMSYGPVESERWPRIAAQVDRILRGAKPQDLPVEQPTKFELLINLKTARALGLTVPKALLLRADEVIQ